MHSSGSMTRMRSASWMQSTGQTSTQDLSLMSMQGSEMMYVTARTLANGPVAEPENDQPDGASSATSSRARSTSADLTTTWSNPAECAALRPAVSVWFVYPRIGTSG